MISLVGTLHRTANKLYEAGMLLHPPAVLLTAETE